MRHASPHRCTQQKHGETTALLPCVCTPVNYELSFTTCPCAFFVRMFCPCRCNFNKLSCVLCAALFAPLGCVSGDSRCCRLFWALIVCFYSALLVRARGPAFRLGVCLWGFPAVVCAATPVPTIVPLCTRLRNERAKPPENRSGISIVTIRTKHVLFCPVFFTTNKEQQSRSP